MRRASLSMDTKIAAAAARRLGFTDAQRNAYLQAVHDAPPVYPDGSPVPIHDIGLVAARDAGYTGPDHPAR